MKIAKWSYEVLGGPLEPIYVYGAGVRVWHWAQAFLFFLLVITGFLIGWPPPAVYGDTWDTYFFGYIIGVHIFCGVTFSVLFLYRCFLAIIGNKYSRMIFVVPFWDWQWWSGMFRQIAYYLFLRPKAPEFVGHNPLAQAAMCAMYVLGSAGIILTGMALYAQQWGWDTSWMVLFGWVTDLLGGAQSVRTVHHLLMYYLLMFCCAHLYMSFREDIMGGATQLSTMTNGVRFFKEPVNGEAHR